MNGIDVSEHQGDFDFTPYKDGFVIIRGGYGIRNADKWAERNIAKCDALGIPWGIYWYSYALNVQTAKVEAERCLRFLNGRKPRLGVWFDMEDADGYKQTNGFPSNETITAMCMAFCAAMEETGNKTGVYANLDWFENRIGDTGYEKWIAAWGWNDGEHYPAFVLRGAGGAEPLPYGSRWERRDDREHSGDGAGGARREVGQRRGAKAEARRVVLRSRAGRSEPYLGGITCERRDRAMSG